MSSSTITIELKISSAASFVINDEAMGKIARRLRREALPYIFKCVDEEAAKNGHGFSHTDVVVDGHIKMV